MTQKFAISLASFYNFGYFDNEMSHFLEGWNLSKIEALSLSLNCPCVWNLESLNYNTIVTNIIFKFFTTLFKLFIKKYIYQHIWDQSMVVKISIWILRSYDFTISHTQNDLNLQGSLRSFKIGRIVRFWWSQTALVSYNLL